MVEIFFGIITRQAIHRGSFNSVRDLVDTIRTFIDSYNDSCHTFIWTKDADTILTKQDNHPRLKTAPLRTLGRCRRRRRPIRRRGRCRLRRAGR